MELKEYQEGVLRQFDRYLEVLAMKRSDAYDFVEFQRIKEKIVDPADYCRDAWDALNAEGALPIAHNTDGAGVVFPHLSRFDGLKRTIPNVCFKVPTGGGKTLLAAAAVERIQTDYLKRQTGVVLWVVPSDAIYRQTWKQLANREHPYRQMLERASGGRVKLMEKSDHFARQDVAGQLCVMLLMLPSANRQTKETLRMFRDSGKFPSFFPEPDDVPANAEMTAKVRNLDVNDLAEIGWKDGVLPDMISIRHSLGNVLRLVQPVIVIDEGHRAYSNNARETLCGFNPSFILELSATPNAGGRHRSNVLVNVPGGALKDEEMIKLPINIVNDEGGDWKQALTLSHAKLSDLEKEAEAFQADSGRYIRPILLVRVERTGNDQRDSVYVHAEDVREFLVQQLGAREEEVRLKTSETDELGSDDLLLDTSPVRYIVTKDALREGWDCPFAYVLAVLSRTTANTALTQMVGRILRQPEARVTGRPALDQCYVFTYDQTVEKAIASVRQGLQEEGMGDLAATSVRISAGPDASPANLRHEIIQRREKFRRLPPIFLPRVLHRDLETSEGWRQLDYDRDILGCLDWDSFEFTKAESWDFEVIRSASRTYALVDLSGVDGQFSYLSDQIPVDLDGQHLDVAFLVRQLLDVVPNPWQGMRILSETLSTLRGRGATESQLYLNRLDLVTGMKRDLDEQVAAAAEAVFRSKLESHDIALRLVASTSSDLNWELAKEIEIDVSDDDKILRHKDDSDLQKTIFEKVYQRDFNTLERNTAWYIDSAESVYWWHRIAVGPSNYALQGWQRHRVYPDFLVCLDEATDGTCRFTLLETKGEFLTGNADTDYKRKLFELLSGSAESAFRAGEMELQTGTTAITFTMIMENSWRDDLIGAGVS